MLLEMTIDRLDPVSAVVTISGSLTLGTNLKMLEAKYSPDHPNTLVCCTNLADAYRAAGRTDLAIRLHQATR